MIVLAVGSALAAGILGWVFLHHLENTYQEGSETVAVLVANRYLVPGTPLAPEYFSAATIPKSYVQPTAITDFAVLESSPGHPRFRNTVALMEGSQLAQTAVSSLFAG